MRKFRNTTFDYLWTLWLEVAIVNSPNRKLENLLLYTGLTKEVNHNYLSGEICFFQLIWPSDDVNIVISKIVNIFWMIVQKL